MYMVLVTRGEQSSWGRYNNVGRLMLGYPQNLKLAVIVYGILTGQINPRAVVTLLGAHAIHDKNLL